MPHSTQSKLYYHTNFLEPESESVCVFLGNTWFEATEKFQNPPLCGFFRFCTTEKRISLRRKLAQATTGWLLHRLIENGYHL
ncbi:hypothetical protein, partial [Pantoea agglomerans]|uniref:hypothetical protein n=1 Tax=Enterobacter agglomerans TaxID=549 RepID=UPI001A7EAAC9